MDKQLALKSAYTLGDYNNVLSIARDIIKESSDVNAYRNACQYIGQVSVLNRNFHSAQLPLLTALQLGSSTARSWIVITARRLFQDGHWLDALQLIKKASDIRSEDCHLADVYIELLLEFGCFAEAKSIFQRYRSSSPVIDARHGFVWSTDASGESTLVQNNEDLKAMALSGLTFLNSSKCIFITNSAEFSEYNLLERVSQSTMVFESNILTSSNTRNTRPLHTLRQVIDLADASCSLLINLDAFGFVTKKSLLRLLGWSWSFVGLVDSVYDKHTQIYKKYSGKIVRLTFH